MSLLDKILIIVVCTFAALNTQAEPDSAIWIDVRTPAEYENGHLPGAYNINFDRIGERINDVSADKSSPIILYCKSGRRSGFAKQTLEQLGYSNVANAGGIDRVLQQQKLAPAAGPECQLNAC